MSHTSATVEAVTAFAGCNAVTLANVKASSLASNSWRSQTCHGGGTRRETASKIVGLRRALDIRLRPWAFRPHIGLLPMVASANWRVAAFKGFCRFLTGNMSEVCDFF